MPNLEFIENAASQSANYIKTHDLKNRKKHNYFPTMVIDDFFADPVLWRHFAINQNYSKPDNLLFPGKRTQPVNEIDSRVFESFANTLISKVSKLRNLNYINAWFHSIDASYGQGWVHDDNPVQTLTGLVYLNETAPLNTGTTIYKDRFDDQADTYLPHMKDDLLFANAEQREKINILRQEQRSNFDIDIQIENVFNRCVLFDPRVWHSADNFFGTNIEDSRLTLVFYIKAES